MTILINKVIVHPYKKDIKCIIGFVNRKVEQKLSLYIRNTQEYMGDSYKSVANYVKQLYPLGSFPTTHLTQKNANTDTEKCIYYIVNLYLYTIIYSDFREYLQLAGIITTQQSSKKALLAKQSPLPNEFLFLNNDINDFNKIIFKEAFDPLKNDVFKQFNQTKQTGEEIWQWAAGIVIVSLFHRMIFKKLNFNGLIEDIKEDGAMIKSKLSTNTLKQIQLISTDNKKRSKSYTRGGTEANVTGRTNFLLSVISLLVILFILYLILIQ